MRVTSSAKAFFEVVDVLIEGFSGGVSSQKSKGFALYETFSDPVRVTGREMRVLKSLCRFKMCADVKRRMTNNGWSLRLLEKTWQQLFL